MGLALRHSTLYIGVSTIPSLPTQEHSEESNYFFMSSCVILTEFYVISCLQMIYFTTCFFAMTACCIILPQNKFLFCKPHRLFSSSAFIFSFLSHIEDLKTLTCVLILRLNNFWWLILIPISLNNDFFFASFKLFCVGWSVRLYLHLSSFILAVELTS